MKMTNLFFYIYLLSCLGGLSGCSSNNVPSEYFKTFDHIVTDQYRETYGQGGIYWVSKDHVVLEAYLKTEQSDLDRGIYQVSVNDGSFKKVVDITDDQPTTYKFCFDGKVLHVMTERGAFKAVNKPNSYQIEIRGMGRRSHSNYYSPFRCDFVDQPLEGGGFKALRVGDGFVRYKRLSDTERSVYLTDEIGAELKNITTHTLTKKHHPAGVFGVKYYLAEKNAYFGYSVLDDKGCAALWWLYRNDWTLQDRKLCLGSKARNGSKLIHDLRDALFLEHYTSASSKSYILKGNKEILIEDGFGRGASVSPNGCVVAYGEGGMSGKSGTRQKLKVFNYCEYQRKEQQI